MKRFYTTVGLAEGADGFGVLLDGRRLKTPAKRPLALPRRGLAEALAAEWQAQEGEIRPDTMPLMQLVSTAMDRVLDAREAVIEETAKYAATDLLCYRASEPRELVERETRLWQPLLDWASLRFDAPLRVTQGLTPIGQPADSLKALRAAVASLDLLALTGVADLTASCASLVLALAVFERRISADEACAAALIEETYQIERWGEDAEAAVRRRRIIAAIQAAAQFLSLVGG